MFYRPGKRHLPKRMVPLLFSEEELHFQLKYMIKLCHGFLYNMGIYWTLCHIRWDVRIVFNSFTSYNTRNIVRNGIIFSIFPYCIESHDITNDYFWPNIVYLFVIQNFLQDGRVWGGHWGVSLRRVRATDHALFWWSQREHRVPWLPLGESPIDDHNTNSICIELH